MTTAYCDKNTISYKSQIDEEGIHELTGIWTRALHFTGRAHYTIPTRFLTCDILEAKENDRSSPKLGHHQLSISNFEGGQDFGRITNLDWAPLEQFTVDFLVFW